MFFKENIKLLRKRRNLTQDEVASALELKRPTLSGYENGVGHPNLQTLSLFSEYYGIAIDTLVKVDLKLLSESQLQQLEQGFDSFIKGSQLRVLATTVDQENEENIELVEEKAKAGYGTGFADPEYIRILPTFKMPFLSKQISGDSMLPIPDKSYVTGEYVADWNDIKNHLAYIILTREDGIVFKVVENRIRLNRKLVLHSLNPLYEPYEIHINQVREVWKFVNYISSEVPPQNKEKEILAEEVEKLKKQVQAIQMKLNL
jgi:transcriptional regulator with XRE-family HTH domain